VITFFLFLECKLLLVGGDPGRLALGFTNKSSRSRGGVAAALSSRGARSIRLSYVTRFAAAPAGGHGMHASEEEEEEGLVLVLDGFISSGENRRDGDGETDFPGAFADDKCVWTQALDSDNSRRSGGDLCDYCRRLLALVFFVVVAA